jgi:hypothetical protein
VASAAHAKERIEEIVRLHGTLARDLEHALDRRRRVARVEDGSRQKSDNRRRLTRNHTPIEELPRSRRKFVARLFVEGAQSKLGPAPRIDEVSALGAEESPVSPFERRDPQSVLWPELGCNGGCEAPACNRVAPERADPLLEPFVFGRECAGEGFVPLAQIAHAHCVAGLPAQAHDLFHRLVYSHRDALLV